MKTSNLYVVQFSCLLLIEVSGSFSNTMIIGSGGLRIKRDINEYGDFVRSFNAPSVDEKFELLGMYVVVKMLFHCVQYSILTWKEMRWLILFYFFQTGECICRCPWQPCFLVRRQSKHQEGCFKVCAHFWYIV